MTFPDPEEHQPDCLLCEAGEPSDHRYERPLTRLVHKEGDGEPCMISPLDYGDMICIHGAALVEEHMPIMVPEPRVPHEFWVKTNHWSPPVP